MSRQEWESDPRLETPPGRFMRRRWPEGSLYVLDIDPSVFRTDYSRGCLLEWKHINAKNKHWTAARTIAKRLGFQAALIEYDVDDDGAAVPLWITWMRKDGNRGTRREFEVVDFDARILAAYGRVAA